MAQFLEGLAILIVEDEFYLADDLAQALTAAGARVLGPFGRIEDAFRMLQAKETIDLALLDIDLMGDRVFPLADVLRERGTPFIFATGYDREIIPDHLADTLRLEKPFDMAAMLAALESVWRP